MKDTYCQSCGMPLSEEVLGTEKDGSKNQEYCSYCYQNGAFTQEMTMQEMIALNADIMAKEQKELSKEELIKQMNLFIPTLKRWKQ